MIRVRTIASKGWRLALCTLLLVWICNAIFSNEARTAWEREGHSWSTLPASERWTLAWTIGPRELWNTLTLVSLPALALSLVFMGLTIFLGVWRWRMVLRVHGLPLPLGRATEISLIAQFFNSFLLGSSGGDLIKAYYAARETHHKKTEAVVTVLIDRLIGLFAMLLFAGIMMLANLRFLLSHQELSAVVWIVLVMLCGSGVLLALMFYGGVSRAWPTARARLRRLPKGPWLEQSLEACRSFGRARGVLARTLAVSFLLNIVCVLQILALARGLHLSVPWPVFFVIVPVIITLSALPITPSGLGVRENLYVLTLSGAALQVPATQALSLSLLAYFGFLVWSLVGGLVYALVRDRQNLREVAHSATAPES